ncbi:hypothetical protein ACLOJK_031982 [Asimina triloba]
MQYAVQGFVPLGFSFFVCPPATLSSSPLLLVAVHPHRRRFAALLLPRRRSAAAVADLLSPSSLLPSFYSRRPRRRSLSLPILAVLVEFGAAVPFSLLSSSSRRPRRRFSLSLSSICCRRRFWPFSSSPVVLLLCLPCLSPVSSHPSASPPPSLFLLP